MYQQSSIYSIVVGRMNSSSKQIDCLTVLSFHNGLTPTRHSSFFNHIKKKEKSNCFQTSLVIFSSLVRCAGAAEADQLAQRLKYKRHSESNVYSNLNESGYSTNLELDPKWFSLSHP